jgi:hypothetical protein
MADKIADECVKLAERGHTMWGAQLAADLEPTPPRRPSELSQMRAYFDEAMAGMTEEMSRQMFQPSPLMRLIERDGEPWRGASAVVPVPFGSFEASRLRPYQEEINRVSDEILQNQTLLGEPWLEVRETYHRDSSDAMRYSVAIQPRRAGRREELMRAYGGFTPPTGPAEPGPTVWFDEEVSEDPLRGLEAPPMELDPEPVPLPGPVVTYNDVGLGERVMRLYARERAILNREPSMEDQYAAHRRAYEEVRASMSETQEVGPVAGTLTPEQLQAAIDLVREDLAPAHPQAALILNFPICGVTVHYKRRNGWTNSERYTEEGDFTPTETRQLVDSEHHPGQDTRYTRRNFQLVKETTVRNYRARTATSTYWYEET